MNHNYVQLLVFLLVAGSGVLRWFFQKLQEQAAQKRKLDEQERRRLETLRTGRDSGAPIRTAPTAGVEIARRQQAEAGQRQRDDAARRQAQIEEFRRRQMERARQRADATRPAPLRPSAPPLLRIPGSTGPTVPMPSRRPVPRAAAPQARPQPAPQPKDRPTPQRQQAPQRPQAPQPASRKPVAAPAATVPQPAQPAVSPVAESLRLSSPPRTVEEWRRAIIVNEILSPPVSDRSAALPSPF